MNWIWRSFRIRSPERDATTDVERTRIVTAAIERVIAEITQEIEGLRKRADEALLNASILTDEPTSETEAARDGFERTLERIELRKHLLAERLEKWRDLARQAETL